MTTERRAQRTAAKEKAQEMLMHGMANVLGYWFERDAAIAEEFGMAEAEFAAVLHAQANRAAKLFGYEEAWTA